MTKASDSEVLSIRVSRPLKSKLERLAKLSGHTKSWHAAKALETYVETQLPIVQGITKALEESRLGKVSPHDEAFARVLARLEGKPPRRRKA